MDKRLLNKIDVPLGGYGCWTWKGKPNGSGYGRHTADGITVRAHQAVYEALRGPVPDGLVLDHICRNRICVNPDHLRVLTRGENVMCGDTIAARNSLKTHCKHGHPLSGDNLWVRQRANGRTERYCLACLKIRNAARRTTPEQE